MGFGQRVIKSVTEVLNPSTYGTSSPVSGNYIKILQDFITWGNTSMNIGLYASAYSNHPLVYMVIHKIASQTSTLELIAEDEKGDVIEKSKLIEFLDNMPNMTRSEFYEESCEEICATGNLFIRKVKGIGAGLTLEVWKSVGVTPNVTGRITTSYNYTRNGIVLKEVPVEEVLHIKFSNSLVAENGFEWGLSALQAGWIIIQSSKEKFTAEANIFKNKGIIGILTNKSDTPMLPKERKRLQEEFDEETGGADRFNKIKISTTDLNYIQTGMSPTDLKLLEGIVSSLRLFCALFGMPSVLFNDLEASTKDNVTQANKTAYQDVYVPLSTKINEGLSPFLNEALNAKETIIVDIASIEALRSSTKPVANALNSLPPKAAERVMEVLTEDEARDLVFLPSTEGGKAKLGKASPAKDDNNGEGTE